MLRVERIKASYDEVPALHEVSFKVESGQIVSIVGANGAGKSTILKSISSVMHLDQGAIYFENQRIDQTPAHRVVDLGIAHVPEGGRLFPQLSVYENLRVGSFLPRARGEATATLKEIYGLFPILDERKRQLADTLSGGERQMLAIARSLMSRPKLILLDEPSSGLAPRVVTRVFEFVHQIKSQGYAILMVEQNVRKGLKLSDRAYLMESGRVHKEGTKQSFLDDPYIKKAYIGL